jgi:hypothetical protein
MERLDGRRLAVVVSHPSTTHPSDEYLSPGTPGRSMVEAH